MTQGAECADTSEHVLAVLAVTKKPAMMLLRFQVQFWCSKASRSHVTVLTQGKFMYVTVATGFHTQNPVVVTRHHGFCLFYILLLVVPMRQMYVCIYKYISIYICGATRDAALSGTWSHIRPFHSPLR